MYILNGTQPPLKTFKIIKDMYRCKIVRNFNQGASDFQNFQLSKKGNSKRI